MYETYYNLNRKPFELAPGAEFLYFSPKHQIALSMLEYGLYENPGGITVITGEIGAGKTTLLQHLMKNTDDSKITLGYISNTHESLGDVQKWVALAFNIVHNGLDKVALYRRIQQFLIEEYAQGRSCVLVVDEAQNMCAATLEELRLITNINSAGDQLVQIILVGQPELLELLTGEGLSQIVQRIGAEYHLGPLTLPETKEYIQHRLTVAGTKNSLFDESACTAIHAFSRGVPRLINSLCEYSLVIGYAQEKPEIDYSVVLEVMKSRRILLADWRANLDDADLLAIEAINVLAGEDVLRSIECR